jgi:methyl-accepting chemotaxis protein
VINPLALPVGIALAVLRDVRQMRDDLHRLADAAEDLPRIEAELTARIDDAEDTVQRGVAGVEALVAALPQIEGGVEELRAARTAAEAIVAGVPTIERGVDDLTRAADAAEKLVGGIDEIRESREVLLEARGTLERASATIEEALHRIEPLQGLTERVGRLADRLPGGHREPR